MIIENPAKGIYIYRNALPESMGIPQKIENALGDGKSAFFKWSEALVGDFQKIKDYRDCVDFKVRRDALRPGDPKSDEIAFIHDQITEKLNECLKHYTDTFRMNELHYMEAINFVKYGPGQHFQVHPDSGPTYHCDVSTVMYLNDDYEGGELMFPHFEYTYKPEYGDIVLFPSNFLYSHAALPVKSGTKYSAVTMFSYNDRTHKEHINPSGNTQGRSRFL
jgi:Rps23 Pro-64 3,4-dihydroxylase Tpa1-like proline 4-hydroxylase